MKMDCRLVGMMVDKLVGKLAGRQVVARKDMQRTDSNRQLDNRCMCKSSVVDKFRYKSPMVVVVAFENSPGRLAIEQQTMLAQYSATKKLVLLELVSR